MDSHTSLDRFIEASVSFFFDDLPTEKSELSLKIQQIKKAFLGTLPADDKDFSQLQRCVQTPTDTLRSLEKHAPNKTLSEVRVALLTYASKRLREAASAALHFAFETDWDEKNIRESFPDEKKAFITAAPTAPPAGELYPIPSNPMQVFSGWIDKDENAEWVYLHLDIEAKAGEKESIKEPIGDVPDFDSDDSDAEDDFFDEQRAEMYQRAVNETATCVLRNLVDEKILTANESKQVPEFTNALLTYRPYINRLRDHNLSFEELKNLTAENIQALTSTPIVQMVAEEKLPFKKAKKLTRAGLDVMENPGLAKLVLSKKFAIDDFKKLTSEQLLIATDPYYNSLIFEGKLKLKQLKKYNRYQCKENLGHVPAINLQKKLGTKIALEKIASMSAGARKILSEEFYYNLLIAGKFPFQWIQQIDTETADFILKKEIINLLGHNIIKLPTALLCNKTQIKNLNRPFIYEALLKNKISIIDVLKLNKTAALLYSKDPLIRQLFHEKLLTTEDLNHLRLESSDDLPDEDYEPQVLSREEKVLFQNALPEFLDLAKAGVLTQSDLHFLHDEFRFSSAPPGKLLTHPDIEDRAELNIMQRISSILDSKPIKLPNGKIDTIKTIVDIAKKLQIDLTDIRENEINRLIKDHHYNSSQPKISQIVDLGKALGFSALELYGRIIGMRILACFNKRPYLIAGTLDNITIIENYIAAMAERENVSISAMKKATIQFFLFQIKEQLKNDLDMVSESTPLVYKSIYQTILHAETECKNESRTLDESTLFANAFNRIKEYVHAALGNLAERSNGNEIQNRWTKRIRFTYTLFGPVNTLGSIAGTKEFCDKFTSIAKMLTLDERPIAAFIPTPAQ